MDFIILTFLILNFVVTLGVLITVRASLKIQVTTAELQAKMAFGGLDQMAKLINQYTPEQEDGGETD